MGVGLGGCGSSGVQPLLPVESAAQPVGMGSEPSASDYSAHLDLLAFGYDDGTYEVRSPAPEHVLSRGRHAAAIINVAVSADGQRLATADRDGVLAVSATASGDMQLLPRAASAELGSVAPLGLAWDHDAKRLATASVTTARVMDVDSGRSRQVELGQEVNAVVFSPDDRELWVGGRRITCLSLPELKETRRFALPTAHGWQAEHPNVLDLRFSPDGRTLGALLDVGVALFDARTGEVQAALVRDWKPVGLRFASDGRMAAFSRSAFYVGPASSQSLKQGLHETTGMLWDIEFRRDDSLLFVGRGIDAEVEALVE
jgi:WD40 repeat protein